VEITGFDPRGPTAKSALRKGDILVGLDDRPVMGVDDVHRALQTWPDGRSAKLRVVRIRDLVEVDVTPAADPDR